MNNNYYELKNFTISDITSIIFIIASVLNIIASDKEKEYLIGKDIKDKRIAYNIYILVLLTLIILYLYFIDINYKAYKNINNQDKKNTLIRLYGSIFFLIGGLAFLYYRINDKNNLETAIEI